MTDTNINDDMDQKPAAVPTAAPDTVENTAPAPAAAPIEATNEAVVYTNPVDEQQLDEKLALEPVNTNIDTAMTEQQPQIAASEQEAPNENFEEQEEAANETFEDEQQPEPEPEPAKEEEATLPPPPPQPTLKDPPPPPPADADAAATEPTKEAPDKEASPPPAVAAAAAAPPPPGDEEEKKPGAVPSTGGEPTMKKSLPPAVEPGDVREKAAKKEAAGAGATAVAGPGAGAGPGPGAGAGAGAGAGDEEEGGATKKDSSEPKPKKEGSKREINAKFKDVQETGSWGGQISTVEKVVVGIVALLIVVGVIVAVVVVLGQDDSPKEEQVPAATAAPTAKATAMPADEKLAIILAELQTNPITSPVAEVLPTDASAYIGKADNEAACTETPSECAMAWALHNDEFPPETNNVVDRYALAAIYYSMQGSEWKNNTNWLTEASYCHWQGISCNRLETEVEEIDLSENDVKGEIPVELSLVDTVAVISMKQNQISGGLPGDVISSMPRLFVLYIQNNLLTGPIPDNLINEEESLALLFIHGNNFTGPFPDVYCGESGFREFTLDCTSKNPCPEDCCKSENCF